MAFQKVIGTAFLRIELHGQELDYRGCRMLVPILHSFWVENVTENSGEAKKLLGMSVR